MEKEYKELVSSYDNMQKKASIMQFIDPDNLQAVGHAIQSPLGQKALKFAGGFATSQAILSGANKLARKKGGDLLQAGVELGKARERANPLKEKPFRTMVGRSGMSPYDTGMQIGKRVTERGLSPEQEARFIDKIRGMALARKERLLAEGGDVPRVLGPLSQIGENEGGLLKRMMTRGSIAEEVKTPIRNFIGDAALSPALVFDKRVIARPLLNNFESKQGYQKTKNILAPEGTRRGIVYDKARNIID